MGRKRKKLPLLEKIEVVDIGSEGKALARWSKGLLLEDKMVVFITNAVPGDIVDVQITRKRKNFMEGYTVKFHKYSDEREEAFCEHFGICGGCKWQSLPYRKQLYYKQKQVSDQLLRIGNISDDEAATMCPILASSEIVGYRNKLEFTFSDNKWLTREELNSGEEFKNRNALGFHIPKKFDKVLDINNCYLQPDPSNQIRAWVRKYSSDHYLDYFNLRQHKGLLRNLIIRTANTGEVMVIISFYDDKQEAREKMLSSLIGRFPQITSLFYVINKKANDTILDQKVVLYHGKEFIIEKMEDLEFKVGPKSFFQTNSGQAYNLYKVVREFADLQGHESVYDFYTGTGTIALFLARDAGKIIGIESVPEAIEDARENSKSNEIENTRFISGDIKDVFTLDLIKKYGHPDIVIMDPPRVGLHKNVVQILSEVKPDKIVYVSCNPATQARDIAMMTENYLIEKIQPVDMFPHTHHVENVCLLKKR